MHVLITGAGGFIGTALSQRLREKSYTITSISRGFYPHLEEMGIQQIQFDLTSNPINLHQRLREVHLQNPIQAVFHVASKVAMWGVWEDFYASNVLATENLVKVCKELQISKLVYTSTPSVVYNGASFEQGDETLSYTRSKESYYAYSKAIAEKYILTKNSTTFKTLAIRPHLVFGKGDLNLIPAILKKAKENKLKIIGNGKNLVDVSYIDNVVDAHELALEALNNNKPIGGDAFFIGQGPVNLWDFINKVLSYNNIPKVESTVSYRFVFFLSYIFEFVFKLFRITKIDPPSTRFVVNQLSKDHYFSHQKAKELLGWEPKVDIDEGLRRLFNP